jgi:hypothetical protein
MIKPHWSEQQLDSNLKTQDCELNVLPLRCHQEQEKNEKLHFQIEIIFQLLKNSFLLIASLNNK